MGTSSRCSPTFPHVFFSLRFFSFFFLQILSIVAGYLLMKLIYDPIKGIQIALTIDFFELNQTRIISVLSIRI